MALPARLGGLGIKNPADPASSEHEASLTTSIKEGIPEQLRRAMELVQEKGSWTWHTALPNREHGFYLHKRGFLDAYAMGHPLTPPQIVLVDQNNQLNMLFSVQEVAPPPLPIMKFEI